MCKNMINTCESEKSVNICCTGRGLNDSPVGLAVYILEKFSTWTDPEFKNLEDGGLER